MTKIVPDNFQNHPHTSCLVSSSAALLSPSHRALSRTTSSPDLSPPQDFVIGTHCLHHVAGHCSLAFADDGHQLLSFHGDGHIYHCDLRLRKCFHKAVDEGCITGSALCTSPDSNLFVAGSTSGIVNIYSREEFLGGKRKPIKTIENLVTRIDNLKFNLEAQILAITSSMQIAA